jgi:CheY-like chemotaxis protein
MRLSEATVLVVDDEPELREIFAAWLGRSAASVLTAANGADALAILTSRKVDALVSDIRMPVMDGITLVRRVFDVGLTIPTMIFVSGFGDVDRREMHALGVEALLEKPLNRADLIGALERGLTEREEMWLRPVSGPANQTVSIDIASLEDAIATQAFLFGRGGCCFPCDQPLAEDETINLHLRFAQQDLILRARGQVCWYSAAAGRAGMVFQYLDPADHGWVTSYMKNDPSRSFIPRGSERIAPAMFPPVLAVPPAQHTLTAT